MNTKTPISVIILAKNEADNIGECISSIKSFASEIIVCDDKSTDSTANTSKKLGALVISASESSSFAEKRNEAMKHSQNDWVLFVDADERVDSVMGNWLEGLVIADHVAGYRLSRVDYFWGKELRRGEVASAFQYGITRLINRKYAVFQGQVHEIANIKPPYVVQKGEGRLKHHAHSSISEFIRDVNEYSSQRALELQGQESIPVTLFKLIFFPLGKFINSYFFKLGFLDGAPGFAYSFVMSFHSFLVRAKILTLF